MNVDDEIVFPPMPRRVGVVSKPKKRILESDDDGSEESRPLQAHVEKGLAMLSSPASNVVNN
jgi:hypothetical protein